MSAGLVLAAGALAFLFGALAPASGKEAAFSAAALCLVAAACTGPFLFGRRAEDGMFSPARRGVLRAALLGGLAAVVCAAYSAAHGGPSLAAAACGLGCGLYAFALGAVADLLRGGVMRVAVAISGLAALATLFYWDEAFLFAAADRKASAALAFELSGAAAASVTLGFDWIHAKGLYTSNQTAESLVHVPLHGMGTFSLKLAGIALAAAGLGLWRRS